MDSETCLHGPFGLWKRQVGSPRGLGSLGGCKECRACGRRGGLLTSTFTRSRPSATALLGLLGAGLPPLGRPGQPPPGCGPASLPEAPAEFLNTVDPGAAFLGIQTRGVQQGVVGARVSGAGVRRPCPEYPGCGGLWGGRDRFLPRVLPGDLTSPSVASGPLKGSYPVFSRSQGLAGDPTSPSLASLLL